MKDPRQVIKRPIITEKGTKVRDNFNQYAFEVYPRVNKIEIRKAVESLFNVKVTEVRTIKVLGKMVRVGRNRGKRPDWKKAIVTLVKGNKIEFYEGT